MPIALLARNAEEKALGTGLVAPIGERGYINISRAFQAPVLDAGKEVRESHGFGFYQLEAAGGMPKRRSAKLAICAKAGAAT